MLFTMPPTMNDYANFINPGIILTQKENIPVLSGEFWTAGQRKGHSLHEISYRACFKPELPEFFISRLTQPGETVLDPFMGRGTTPLQAALSGRRPAGNDANPLSIQLLKPRLRPPEISDIEDELGKIAANPPDPGREDLLPFYHPETLGMLRMFRRVLDEEIRQQENPAAEWIRMVCLNRLTGHSSGYFSGYTLPPNQAVSIPSQERINKRLGITPPVRNIPELIMRKTRSLLRKGVPGIHPAGILSAGKADSIPGIEDNSVSLVVTSPPFLDIVQYADDNWLRNWFGCTESSDVPEGIHRTENGWENMMTRSMREMARVLKNGGHAAIEIGEVRKGKVQLENNLLKAAEGLPLKPVMLMLNTQSFTKTANLWGVSNNAGGTNTNRIILFRKED